MTPSEKYENNRTSADGYAARLDTATDKVVTAAKETASQAGEKLDALAENARSLGESGIEALSKMVGRSPMAAIGIAAGVGLLAGLMCRRDNR
ncbi:MAG: hypothetical protein ACOVKO_00695 [Elstera sp.]